MKGTLVMSRFRDSLSETYNSQILGTQQGNNWDNNLKAITRELIQNGNRKLAGEDNDLFPLKKPYLPLCVFLKILP